MEEEKAADYYNELLQKGGNAARFKQGLGFGAPATSVSNTEGERGSFTNFVKGASFAENGEDLNKEIKLEAVRNKLQKRQSAKDDREQEKVA
jgi:hypothetical protein